MSIRRSTRLIEKTKSIPQKKRQDEIFHIVHNSLKKISRSEYTNISMKRHEVLYDYISQPHILEDIKSSPYTFQIIIHDCLVGMNSSLNDPLWCETEFSNKRHTIFHELNKENKPCPECEMKKQKDAEKAFNARGITRIFIDEYSVMWDFDNKARKMKSVEWTLVIVFNSPYDKPHIAFGQDIKSVNKVFTVKTTALYSQTYEDVLISSYNAIMKLI